jgi:hypothetical protein
MPASWLSILSTLRHFHGFFWQIAFFRVYSGQHSPIDSMVSYRQVLKHPTL